MARRSSLQACRRAAAPSQPGASSWLASAVAGPPNGELSGSAAVTRPGEQRADPRPDEGVVGRERLADRRIRRGVGGGERGLQQPPGLGRADQPEGAPYRAVRRHRPRPPAAFQQRGDLGRHPAVAQQAAGVVVDHHDERVRIGPRVTEQADHFVAIPEDVGVHVAFRRRHRADVLGPGGPRDPPLDQRQRRPSRPGPPGGACPGRLFRTAGRAPPGWRPGPRTRPAPHRSLPRGRRRGGRRCAAHAGPTRCPASR